MSDREQLAARLVEAAATAIANENPYDLTGMDGTPHESEVGLAEVALVAALRELAANPDGYLRYQEDGGITYTKTLRGLADYIEKGAGDGQH